MRFIDDFLNNEFKKISGWCVPHLFNVIQPIHEYQEKNDLNSPVAEIGVYHGKFFIPLALLKSGSGTSYAIDVYEDQEFNIDNAGVGDREIFKNNILAVDRKLIDSTEFYKKDSSAINSRDINKIVNDVPTGFSMFSIDGCHTVEHTLNDLMLAQELTNPSGIIFVDDFTNVHWPGVEEAVAKYYFFQKYRYLPLAVTCNKLILAHVSHHGLYLDLVKSFLLENYPSSRTTVVKRYGHDCLNYIPDTNAKYLVY